MIQRSLDQIYAQFLGQILTPNDNFVQKQPGSEIIFKAVNINEAEKAFAEYLEYKKKKFSSFN
jgi:hypothetical protein